MANIPLIAPVVGASVDWLSMSCDRMSAMAGLFDWWLDILKDRTERGYEVSWWRRHGYEGQQVDSVGYGSNGTSIIIKLSGESARRYWRALAVESTNVSRIDLATTVCPVSDVGALARDEFEAVTRLAKRRGRPITYRLIRDSLGGESLSVGSRVSDAFGRLYNKGAESRDPAYAGCWRYEVEYKRKVANAKALALLSSSEEALAITGDCYRWFSARNVRPCFAPGDVALGDLLPEETSDSQRWLKWARQSVRPGALRAVERYGWLHVALALCGKPADYMGWAAIWEGIEEEMASEAE